MCVTCDTMYSSSLGRSFRKSCRSSFAAFVRARRKHKVIFDGWKYNRALLIGPFDLVYSSEGQEKGGKQWNLIMSSRGRLLCQYPSPDDWFPFFRGTIPKHTMFDVTTGVISPYYSPVARNSIEQTDRSVFSVCKPIIARLSKKTTTVISIFLPHVWVASSAQWRKHLAGTWDTSDRYLRVSTFTWRWCKESTLSPLYTNLFNAGMSHLYSRLRPSV